MTPVLDSARATQNEQRTTRERASAPRRAGGAGPRPRRGSQPQGPGGSSSSLAARAPRLGRAGEATQGKHPGWVGKARRAAVQQQARQPRHSARVATRWQQPCNAIAAHRVQHYKQFQYVGTTVLTSMVRMGSAMMGPLPAVMSKGMFTPLHSTAGWRAWPIKRARVQQQVRGGRQLQPPTACSNKSGAAGAAVRSSVQHGSQLQGEAN